jgi:hypothetical protein
MPDDVRRKPYDNAYSSPAAAQDFPEAHSRKTASSIVEEKIGRASFLEEALTPTLNV